MKSPTPEHDDLRISDKRSEDDDHHQQLEISDIAHCGFWRDDSGRGKRLSVVTQSEDAAREYFQKFPLGSQMPRSLHASHSEVGHLFRKRFLIDSSASSCKKSRTPLT